MNIGIRILIGVCMSVNGGILHSFKLGIETIGNGYGNELRVQGLHKIGLVTNQSGVDQQGRRTIDILHQRAVPLSCIIVPEHGLSGAIQAEVAVPDSRDAKTGLEIKSFYGGGGGKKVDYEVLKSLDAVFFDIQDVGLRHYTYISTLLELLKAASITGTRVIIFDRPNVSGAYIEGPIPEPHLVSFISVSDIPLRYGVTIGELALYFNKYVLERPAQVDVVPMAGYDRASAVAVQTFLSPNIRTLAACRLYTFLGLVSELRPFDVCVGTDRAFECLLLPEKVVSETENLWPEVQTVLAGYGIDSILYDYYSTRKKQRYTGLRLIPNRPISNALQLFIALIHLIKQKGVALQPSASFDKVAGHGGLRECIAQPNGASACADFLRTAVQQQETFFQKIRPLLLYSHASVDSTEL